MNISNKFFELHVVSVEEKIFSGNVIKLHATGIFGEFEILPNHAPFLSILAPGSLWFIEETYLKKEVIILGGTIEVQPHRTTVLADSYAHTKNIDETEILKTKVLLEQQLQKPMSDFDHARARTELLYAIAQLKFLRKVKKK